MSDECAGRVYRCRLNHFLSAKGEVVWQTRFVPMKRLSCPGCEHCGWADEFLQEFIGEGHLLVKNEEHGALYQLRVTNEHRDWETGIVDDWDLELVKL